MSDLLKQKDLEYGMVVRRVNPEGNKYDKLVMTHDKLSMYKGPIYKEDSFELVVNPTYEMMMSIPVKGGVMVSTYFMCNELNRLESKVTELENRIKRHPPCANLCGATARERGVKGLGPG